MLALPKKNPVKSLLRVELTKEQAVHLVEGAGYIVANPIKVVTTQNSMVVLVESDVRQAVRITRNRDGAYRLTLEAGTGEHSNDPVFAKRIRRQKRLRCPAPQKCPQSLI